MKSRLLPKRSAEPARRGRPEEHAEEGDSAQQTYLGRRKRPTGIGQQCGHRRSVNNQIVPFKSNGSEAKSDDQVRGPE